MLDVPADAQGTFEVGLFHPPATLMKGVYGERISLIACVPAKITVECTLADPPGPEPTPIAKNRYLSFVPANPGRQTAIHVTFADLPSPYDAVNRTTMWVGEPLEVTEAAGSSAGSPPPTFLAAPLQCNPYYMDWGSLGTVHVYDKGILPEGTYEVRAVEEGCPPGLIQRDAVALELTTALWGDVVGDCSVPGCTPPNGVADFDDISAVVDKFRNVPNGLSKARADLAGDTPSRTVDFLDISMAVNAFRGIEYRFDGPSGCP